ncbi:hypothetical protein MRX96_050644 [Rhipicephalus microplus]
MPADGSRTNRRPLLRRVRGRRRYNRMAGHDSTLRRPGGMRACCETHRSLAGVRALRTRSLTAARERVVHAARHVNAHTHEHKWSLFFFSRAETSLASPAATAVRSYGHGLRVLP